MAKNYGKDGKWVFNRDLSGGAQSKTFLVHRKDDPDERPYVLKRFSNLKRWHRCETEVAAALKLEHPNLIKHVDSDLDTDVKKPFMVMEYCAGGSLNKANLNGWTTIERFEFFRLICEGVGYAHQNGIIHRDLKPDNIFLREDGKTPVVGDFGICFIDEGGERFTLTDEAVGARHFTAPELEDGRTDQITARADVYSLGKILYWIFAGKIFDREKHRDHRYNLSRQDQDLKDTRIAERAFVNELLDRSITLDPNDRFGNANHFGANVDRTIWRLLRHAHVLDLSEIQICNFCGIGHYKIHGDSVQFGKHDGNDDLNFFGVKFLGHADWLILKCSNCGHIQEFQFMKGDRGIKKPWWNNETGEQ